MKKVYDIAQLSISNRQDFDFAFNSKYNITEGTNDNVGVDQYFFNDTAGVLSVNNGGSRQMYYRLPFSNCNLGDEITIEFDCLTVSGAFRIFVLESPSSTVYTEVITPNVLNTWTKYTRKFFAKSNTNIQVCVGMNGIAGNIKLKNVTSMVKRNMGNSVGEEVISFRKANIHRVSGAWNVRSEFISDDITITESDANTLQITYAKPYKGKIPIVIIDSQCSGMSYTTTPRTQNSTLNGFQIKFYDNSGTNVALASVSVNTYFSFLAVGCKTRYEF